MAYGAGSIARRSGYACQQAAMIASWRAVFSSEPGTTDSAFPFGITSLAGGCSESNPLWSDDQPHFTKAQWSSCDGTAAQLPRNSPLCVDIRDDWAAGLRLAQTGGHGHLPNAALPNTFLGQAWDHGEPCPCDRHALPPNGCWAPGTAEACYGWTSEYSLNRTWNYEISAIHPRAKEPIGQRLARAAHGLTKPTPQPQPTPKFAGCRLVCGFRRPPRAPV